MTSSSGIRVGAEAVVTGASSGIGRAIAMLLGRAGMRVLLVGRSAERLQEAAQVSGAAAETLACDLTIPAGLAALAARVPASLQVLVHAAGWHQTGALSATEDSTLDRLFAINVHAPYQVTRLCLPALRAAQGQVVFI